MFALERQGEREDEEQEIEKEFWEGIRGKRNVLNTSPIVVVSLFCVHTILF